MHSHLRPHVTTAGAVSTGTMTAVKVCARRCRKGAVTKIEIISRAGNNVKVTVVEKVSTLCTYHKFR